MSSRTKVNIPDMRRLIDDGLTTAQIAAHFGVQSPAITRTCRTYGIPLPRSTAEPTRADDERALECIRRVASGEGFHAVAFRFRMSNRTVQKIVREVEEADIAESGEPVRAVARHYANPRRRRA